MAKFTSPLPLNMAYEGHAFVGPPGTEFRIPDSLRDVFDEEYGDRVQPVWVIGDEIAAAGGGSAAGHPDLNNHLALGIAATVHTHGYAATAHSHAYADPAHTHDYAASGHGHSYAATVHTHDQSSVTNLVGDLAGKAAAIHTHAQSSVTNLVSDLAGKAASVHQHAYSTLTGIPSTFTPASHSHVDGDLPAGLARDSEVSAAIAQHEATATHGGSGGGGADIKSGVVELAAGGSVAVTFATPFASVPRVVATTQFSSADSSTNLSIHSITVNGFTLRGAGNAAGNVAWIATTAGNT